MTFPTPFTGSEQPGLRRFDVTGLTVSTSPATIDLTVPEPGVWLVTFGAWFGGQNNRGLLTAVVDFYRYSGSWMLAANPIGAPTLIGTMTGLTVSAPTSGGVIAVTATSSSGNSEVRAGANGRLISSVADQFAI